MSRSSRFPSLAPLFKLSLAVIKVCILSLLLLTLDGCGTSTHATRPSTASRYSDKPMIIDRGDIEPSSAAIAKSARPSIKAQSGGRHIVRPGETLWAISKLYGIEVNTLANINSLSDSSTIEVGQVLILPGSQPTKTVNYSAKRSSTFIWPVRGAITSRFGSKTDKFVNKGLDIRATEGADVLASRGGKIVYCDSHLKGFGQTVIIDHMDGFQTVYSYNQSISVKVGDVVEQRYAIAKVGSSGRAKEPMLHFEIRKNGEPQNPEFYLSK